MSTLQYDSKFDTNTWHTIKKSERLKDMLKLLTLVALSAALPASAEDTCSAAASAAARVHAARTTAHDSFTLTYFNGRGLAEIPRTSKSSSTWLCLFLLCSLCV